MASRRPHPQADRPAPRLTLVTSVVEDAEACARLLAEVLPEADIAAIVLRLAAADERSLINRIKIVAPAVQQHDVALLLDGHADLVARSGADGAHLTGIATLQEWIGRLHPSHIAAAGGLKTRHDAMLAAEQGADYVMFGEPDPDDGHRPAFPAIIERVAWWAEVFEPPCVGYAGSLDEITPLAAAGADFIALADWIWTAEAGPAATIAQATRLMAAAEAAA
jgi:thiamine-phosphate pyrophosphorylase